MLDSQLCFQEQRKLNLHIIAKVTRLGYVFVGGMCCKWQDMTQQTGRAIEPKMEWYIAFIQRFADLSFQKTKKRRNVEVRGTTDVNVKNYFQELDTFLTKYNLKK